MDRLQHFHKIHYKIYEWCCISKWFNSQLGASCHQDALWASVQLEWNPRRVWNAPPLHILYTRTVSSYLAFRINRFFHHVMQSDSRIDIFAANIRSWGPGEGKIIMNLLGVQVSNYSYDAWKANLHVKDILRTLLGMLLSTFDPDQVRPPVFWLCKHGCQRIDRYDLWGD